MTMNPERLFVSSTTGNVRYILAVVVALGGIVGCVVLTLYGYGGNGTELLLSGFAFASLIAGVTHTVGQVAEVNGKVDHLLNGGTAIQIRTEVGKLLADFAAANNQVVPPSVAAAAIEDPHQLPPVV